MACSLLHLARGPQPGPQRAVRCSLIMSMQVASYTCHMPALHVHHTGHSAPVPAHFGGHHSLHGMLG